MWTAVDAKSKLVPNFTGGRRDAAMADISTAHLAARLSHRVQGSPDTLAASAGASEKAFGEQIEHVSISKTYCQPDVQSARRYVLLDVVCVRGVPVQDKPVEKLISTPCGEGKGVHLASEAVIELFRGDVAWDDVVETFDLIGCAKAERYHTWS